MTAYTSSGLGWTANQNISTQLASFFSSTAADGDSLLLEETFVLNRATSGQINMPPNFTLSATDGAGLSCTTVDTGSAALTQFYAGEGCLFDNLTVRFPNAPNTGTTSVNPVAGTDYMRHIFIEIDSVADVEIRNCDFEGQISIWIELKGGLSRGADGFLMRGCRIWGGWWQTTMSGDVYAPRFEDCYLGGAVGETIKSVLFNTNNASGWVGPRSDGTVKNVLRCTFTGSNRDAIDTTGGVRSWVIEDNFFDGDGLDFKVPLKEANDPATIAATVWTTTEADGYPIWGCYDVEVNNCYFKNISRNINFTLDIRPDTDGYPSVSDFQRLVPQKFRFNNCKWEHLTWDAATRGGLDLTLIKSGDDIVFTNLTTYDKASVAGTDVIHTSFSSPGTPPGWSPDVGFTVTGLVEEAGVSGIVIPGWTKIDAGTGEPAPVVISLLNTVITVTATAA